DGAGYERGSFRRLPRRRCPQARGMGGSRFAALGSSGPMPTARGAGYRSRLSGSTDADPCPSGCESQRVDQLVLLVPCVTLGPAPRHRVARLELEERFPQVLVLDRLAARRTPPVGLPALQPAVRESLLQVLAVSDDRDSTALCQCSEGPDGRCQFHTVVGGVSFEARSLLALVAVLEEVSPAAPARARVTRTVGERLHLPQPCVSHLCPLRRRHGPRAPLRQLRAWSCASTTGG